MPSHFPIKTPPHPWNDIPGSLVPVDGTPSLRSWQGGCLAALKVAQRRGQTGISGQCPEASQHGGGPAEQAVVPDLVPDLAWPPPTQGAIPPSSPWAQSRCL